MVVADSKERNESAMGILYRWLNHFLILDGDDAGYDARDRERCDDDRGGDYEDRFGNVLPASAAYHAPFQAIHSLAWTVHRR